MQRESVLSNLDSISQNNTEIVQLKQQQEDRPQTFHPVKKNNNYGMFKDSVVLFNKGSRKQLPHLVLDEPVAFWKIIKNVIGQDLTKVSLPVILNEPACAL